MHKIYLLLRNNKQSGPYSLNELVALPLKPLDLLWVEGKSKSWAYPSTIDELKGCINEEDKASESVTVYPKADQKLVLPRTRQSQQEEKKQEGIKVKVYVELPNAYREKRLLSEKESTDDESYGSGDMDSYTLSTKYVRDLDEIKEQYSAWIRKQKKNPKVGVRKNKLVIAAVILLLVTAACIAEKWGYTPADSTPKLKAGTIKVIQTPATPEPIKKSKSKKSNRSADSKKDKSRKAASSTPASAEERKENKESGKEKEETGSERELNAITLFKKLEIKFSHDESAEGVSGLRFTLHNGSDHKLNTVGLTIYYHDGSENVVSKETIYFNNLLAGGSGSQAAPAHAEAVSVTYKIAMVSVNNSIYYGKE